jgi:hypothetical protein
MNKKTLPSLDMQAHGFISRVVSPEDLVVDATAGNGNDTLFLAGLVGSSGLVLAFDAQREALEHTRKRLDNAGITTVTCIHAGHEDIGRHLDRYAPNRPVAAAMFDLGFLADGDRMIVTRAETTLAACRALLERLKPAGLISIHMYTGHQGGTAEVEALLAWAGELPWETWHVLRISSFNKQRNTEHLLLVEKRQEPRTEAPCQPEQGD